ncbi:MAG: transglutaminase domain-containing protein [Oscillospiraceae bacterium]|nr:transglutaminase domain-containing protein [Oscillospiraceae bacterium]
MKVFKRLIALLLVAAIAICIINAETDVFLNFGSYAPAVEEKFPQISSAISNISERLSRLTDYIPSPSEIIAMIKDEELPIDPADVATNAYIENSPLLTFYPDENIGMIVDFNTIQIFGTTTSKNKAHLIVEFTDENGESVEQVSVSVGTDNEFNKTITIPDTDGLSLDVAVYAGSKPYGQFESWVYNYVTLFKTPDGGWEMEKSPVFDNNKIMYEKDKSTKDALKSTASIQSESSSIISIATQLTEGIENDYDKVLALHDWICSYMYYDTDSLSSQETPPYYATEIVQTRKAVCLGFATLMAALCRSIEIPCNVVSGYALGVGTDTEWTDETIGTEYQNHAWNEVYVDGRWVIVDTTWDCTNKIENGEMIKGSGVSHIYFDANLQYFSNNHKIVEYSKKR